MTPILLCVLAAALMPIVCAGLAKRSGFGRPRRDCGYDNHAPRDWLARQTGLPARANAAQANGFEALPFFIGAVAIALPAGAPLERVQALAIAWVLLRLAYVGCYLADRQLARSLVWAAAFAVNIAILLSAA
ncbi:MAG TPA: MAPEG family protein [Methylibium sp.]|nr:MAPEG family protein [Methylibium sp.]